MSMEVSDLPFKFSDFRVKITTFVRPAEVLEGGGFSRIVLNNGRDDLAGLRINCLRPSLLCKIVALVDEVVELIRCQHDVFIDVGWFGKGK